ncbi:hypothetical protein, partial [Kozakia baliensis]|uniref:hypothetical protein n=1 Tax=Kozakia baliensis TaxID=153496 RepID=UPI001F3170E3
MAFSSDRSGLSPFCIMASLSAEQQRCYGKDILFFVLPLEPHSARPHSTGSACLGGSGQAVPDD